MAKAAKKVSKRTYNKKTKADEPELHWEGEELVDENGVIIKDTREQQAARVILPRDIREARTDKERNELDRRAYTKQLEEVQKVLKKTETKKRPNFEAHFKRMETIIKKNLEALK